MYTYDGFSVHLYSWILGWKKDVSIYKSTYIYVTKSVLIHSYYYHWYHWDSRTAMGLTHVPIIIYICVLRNTVPSIPTTGTLGRYGMFTIRTLGHSYYWDTWTVWDVSL